MLRCAVLCLNGLSCRAAARAAPAVPAAAGRRCAALRCASQPHPPTHCPPTHYPPTVVDLTVNLEKAASYEEIMAELQRASQEELKGILG